MAVLKPGTRLKSVVCDTEVMVIKTTGDGVLQCGGEAAIEANANAQGSHELNDNFAAGSLVGKRYVNEDQSLEVLCVKPGKGSLSVDDQPLVEKSAKSLPSTD